MLVMTDVLIAASLLGARVKRKRTKQSVPFPTPIIASGMNWCNANSTFVGFLHFVRNDLVHRGYRIKKHRLQIKSQSGVHR